MLIEVFPAPMFATNCWVIAPGPGGECIIVDPGMPDVSRNVEMIVEQFKLKPVAALLTHGHLDHTYSIKPLADGYAIPTYIHSEDRALIAHPERALGAEFAATLTEMTFLEPVDVREIRHGATVELLDMKIQVIHAPGHTRGSLMFMIDGEVLVSGDVLFAGSIGRTDLPTGSHDQMMNTLTTRILTLSDAVRVLPGHGPETTIERERKSNPYLKELKP